MRMHLEEANGVTGQKRANLIAYEARGMRLKLRETPSAAAYEPYITESDPSRKEIICT